MGYTLTFPVDTGDGDLELDITLSGKNFKKITDYLETFKSTIDEEDLDYWYEELPDLEEVEELKSAVREIRKKIVTGLACSIHDDPCAYEDLLEEEEIDIEDDEAMEEFVRDYVQFSFAWPEELFEN